MTKITNTLDPATGGARGVESKTGTVYIEPGETVDVDLKDEKAPLYEGLEAGEAAARKAAKAEAKAEAEPGAKE